MLGRAFIFPIIVPLTGVAVLGIIAGSGDGSVKIGFALFAAIFFAAVLRAQRVAQRSARVRR